MKTYPFFKDVLSENVAFTPNCIGNKLYSLLWTNASSIADIYSIKGFGFEFPTLKIL